MRQPKTRRTDIRLDCAQIDTWRASRVGCRGPLQAAIWKSGVRLIRQYPATTGHRDGITHIRMSPLEFTQRLAALVPRARLHLLRFHGVLAPNAGLRAAIMPGPPEKPGDAAAHHAQAAPARIGWARLCFKFPIRGRRICANPRKHVKWALGL